MNKVSCDICENWNECKVKDYVIETENNPQVKAEIYGEYASHCGDYLRLQRATNSTW